MFNLRSLWSGSRHLSERKAVPYSPPRFRPQLEGFEDRTVPAAPSFGPALTAPVINQAQITDLINITSVTLPQLEIVDGVLRSVEGSVGSVAGTLAGLPFTTDITNFALDLVNPDASEGEECAILHLELAPIDISLLGLNVDTSAICLDVTAIAGGGLLGNLLCGLADDIPLGLGEIDLGGLTGAVQQIIGGVLGQEMGNAAPGQGPEDICDGECEILDLVLGPVDLTLLGLNVHLDNCADGPVQLCVSASAGEGLLGNLLCGLSNTPILNLDLADITELGTRITELNADGEIAGRDRGELASLINKLRK